MILPFERRVPDSEDVDENVDLSAIALDFQEPFVSGEIPPSSESEPDEGSKAWRARMRRRDRVQLAADSAVRRWHELTGTAPNAPPVIRPLPRPEGLGVVKAPDAALPPRRQEEVFKAGTLRTILRLFVWVRGGLHFIFGILADKLHGRDNIQRRAVRLRLAFEAMGTTFIKFGQQLSMRLDVLPYAYTRELESMLDRVEPMDEDAAIATVERVTKRSIDETFSAFDRKPIGSASVACVYQAVLRTGERVAVKVRRPGIGNRLAADMRALEWLLAVAEMFFVPPGFTSNFMHELRTMLFEELDFVREARFTDLFRKKMRKTKQLGFATAPKVFFAHSSTEVLVTEFVQGIWMNELLTALESEDRDAIDKLREMNIEPLILARRIQLVARFNNFEHIFFHADIHPANLLVQPGNRIVLIDFGSCGSFSRKELNSWRRWFDAQSVNDVGGMVQAALGIIEPLPPIDKDEFALRLETMFWNDLYAIKDKHSDWSERISARLWLGFLKLSREFRVPMRLNTLRMIRASMLADTIAARLDNDQDPYEEFRHYERGAGRRARKRTAKRLRRLLGPGKWTRLENGIEAGLKFVYQVQKALDSLGTVSLVPLIGKAAEASILLFGVLGRILVLLSIFATVYSVMDPHLTLPQVLLKVFKNYLYHAFVLIIVLIAVRKLRARLRDREY